MGNIFTDTKNYSIYSYCFALIFKLTIFANQKEGNMIKSMTGYGREILELPSKTITIEIKSLNSRNLDMNARVPGLLKDKEMEIRSMIGQKMGRGKVDINIYHDYTGEENAYSLNKELAKRYYKELRAIVDEIEKATQPDYLHILTQLPDVVQSEKETFNESEWEQIKKGIVQVLKTVDHFRDEEGEMLADDFKQGIDHILGYLHQVDKFEKERTITIKERLKKNLYEFFDQKDVDNNRFEQELVYYLEKLDITEEKVRLKKHCDYFNQTLSEKESQGKKLNFISQEIGREINTLGAKANDVDIQRLVVQMKAELEKIKEQIANIL